MAFLNVCMDCLFLQVHLRSGGKELFGHGGLHLLQGILQIRAREGGAIVRH